MAQVLTLTFGRSDVTTKDIMSRAEGPLFPDLVLRREDGPEDLNLLRREALVASRQPPPVSSSSVPPKKKQRQRSAPVKPASPAVSPGPAVSGGAPPRSKAASPVGGSGSVPAGSAGTQPGAAVPPAGRKRPLSRGAPDSAAIGASAAPPPAAPAASTSAAAPSVAVASDDPRGRLPPGRTDERAPLPRRRPRTSLASGHEADVVAGTRHSRTPPPSRASPSVAPNVESTPATATRVLTAGAPLPALRTEAGVTAHVAP